MIMVKHRTGIRQSWERRGTHRVRQSGFDVNMASLRWPDSVRFATTEVSRAQLLTQFQRKRDSVGLSRTGDEWAATKNTTVSPGAAALTTKRGPTTAPPEVDPAIGERPTLKRLNPWKHLLNGSMPRKALDLSPWSAAPKPLCT